MNTTIHTNEGDLEIQPEFTCYRCDNDKDYPGKLKKLVAVMKKENIYLCEFHFNPDFDIDDGFDELETSRSQN